MKRRGRRLLALGTLVCTHLLLFSQVVVTGKVVNTENRPMENVEVCLLNKDSVGVQSELSDAAGDFSISTFPGNYTLCVRYFSKILYTKSIVLQKNKDLDTLQIQNTVNLNEVVFEGKKRSILERKADRIVYHISNDTFNKGTKLMDALRSAPRVNVENDQVSIIGKSGTLKVMIDGRLQNLSDDALKAKLKSLQTNQVDRVEIIPTPPSRYSAEGNGGMINIILKTSINDGISGDVNTSLTDQFGKITTTQGVNLNYKHKKLNASISINNMLANSSNDNRYTYDFQDATTHYNSASNFNIKSPSINAVLQYQLTSKWNLGTTFNCGETKFNVSNPSTTSYYDKTTQANDSILYSTVLSNNKYNNQAISLYSDYSLDSLGKKISLIYNYSHNKNTTGADNNSQTVSNTQTNNLHFTNFGENRYTINGLIVDLELPFKFVNIETGAAYTQINNNSTISYYNATTQLDPTRSNQFNYRETTTAAYFSVEKQWTTRWTTKAGLREEHTQIQGHSRTLNQENTTTYTKLFPTVFISYNPNDNHTLTLSYSKRLDRPNFYDLNPFRDYSTPHNYTEGNPNLLPSYTNALELSYTLKNNFNITTYGNYITDGIAYITQADSNTYKVHPINNYTQQKAGMIASYTLKPTKWNRTYANFEGYYTHLKSAQAVHLVKGFGGSFNIRSSFQLNKASTSLLELSYRQALPSHALYDDSYTQSYGYFTLNFKQMCLNNNLVFNLYISDVFRQNIRVTEKQYDTFNYTYYNDSHNRGITLEVSYTFGNQKVSSIYKDTKNEDKYRGSK